MKKIIFQRRRFSHPNEPKILELDLPFGGIFDISSDLNWICLHFKIPVSEKFRIVQVNTVVNLSEKVKFLGQVIVMKVLSVGGDSIWIYDCIKISTDKSSS